MNCKPPWRILSRERQLKDNKGKNGYVFYYGILIKMGFTSGDHSVMNRKPNPGQKALFFRHLYDIILIMAIAKTNKRTLPGTHYAE